MMNKKCLPGALAVLLCFGLLACGDRQAAAPAASAAASAPLPVQAGASGAASAAASASSPVADLPPVPEHSGAQRSAESLYQSICAGCHDKGVAGAPKPGDAQDWAARKGGGVPVLLQSVIHGKNAMPPKGTLMDASDAELQSVIELMLQS